jgi:hypothetical protein
MGGVNKREKFEEQFFFLNSSYLPFLFFCSFALMQKNRRIKADFK